MVTRGRSSEQVVGQPEPHEVFYDDAVVPVGELLNADPFLLGLHQQGRAVFIRAGDHQNVISDHALIPRENVGGNSEASDVPDMTGAVGVGPSYTGKNTFGHVLQTMSCTMRSRMGLGVVRLGLFTRVR